VRVDPAIYEAHYQRKLACGEQGWFDAAGIALILQELDERMIKVELGPSVLEVGCGAGDQSLHLASRGFHVTGVDISPTAIAWARKNAETRGLSVEFVHEDACSLVGFQDSKFDWVLDGNCWHFIVGKDRRTAFLRSIFRVLRPDGVFLSTTLCGLPEKHDSIQMEGRVQVVEEVGITYFAEEPELLEQLACSGLQVTQTQLLAAKPGSRSQMLQITAIKPN
jgi:ubiquinone/menaquinone biosynthesis C-methylase UbiE